MNFSYSERFILAIFLWSVIHHLHLLRTLFAKAHVGPVKTLKILCAAWVCAISSQGLHSHRTEVPYKVYLHFTLDSFPFIRGTS